MPIVPTRGLDGSDLDAIASLQERVVAADGGRLKLEWPALRRRAPDEVRDVLAWDADRLVGFAGCYGPRTSTPELAGMVDPTWRRRGVGGALLRAALGVAAEHDSRRALLIVPRASVGGRALAERRGGSPHHSEHALVLTGPPADGPSDGSLTLRRATTDDLPTLRRLLASGFGTAPADLAERIDTETAYTVLAYRDTTLVATIHLERDGDSAGVYGFVVAPPWRGRGIGRDVLRRVCTGLRAAGVTRIGLEVALDNDRALGLYTSLGFRPLATEDYFTLALPG